MKTPIFLALISHLVFASNDNFPIGARAVGLGNTAVTIKDQYAVFNNIAGIAALENMYISAGYENRFQFKGFNSVFMAANLPTKLGNGGLGLARFGDELYSETKINLGWAHKISFVSLGFQAEYFQTSIQDIGTKRNIALNFGGQVNITKELAFGAHIYNLNQAKLANYKDERLPTIMKTGFSYKPIKQLLVAIEVEKDVEKQMRYKFGLEYSIIENLKLRTGVNVQPQVAFFGIGYQNKVLFIDYASTWHQQLGFSHTISLSFKFLKLGNKPLEIN